MAETKARGLFALSLMCVRRKKSPSPIQKGRPPLKLFRQAIIIFGIYLLGEWISKSFHLMVPGNILGMLMLLGLLCSRRIKLEQVEDMAGFLLDHLAFFFIPAGVGILSIYADIRGIWPQLLLICVVTTAITMAAAGKMTDAVLTNHHARNDKGDASHAASDR